MANTEIKWPTSASLTHDYRNGAHDHTLFFHYSNVDADGAEQGHSVSVGIIATDGEGFQRGLQIVEAVNAYAALKNISHADAKDLLNAFSAR